LAASGIRFALQASSQQAAAGDGSNVLDERIDVVMKTLLLICALGTSHADCSIATAEAVIQGPDAASLGQCGLHAQAYIADGAIAGYLGAHYLKIACTSGEPPHAVPEPPVHSTAQVTR
jgi:hypothetical protein